MKHFINLMELKRNRETASTACVVDLPGFPDTTGYLKKRTYGQL